MKAENWINSILNSTDTMLRVSPKTDLFSKIEARIVLQINTVSNKTVWLVAASMVVLIAINMYTLQKNKAIENPSSEILIALTLNKSNQLY
jgi:hypothetical protein